MNILLCRFRRVFFVLTWTAFSYTANAQFHEIGGGIGVSNVRTDLSKLRLANTGYGGWLFYRYNFNQVWVGRADMRYLYIHSSDSSSSYPVAGARHYEFSSDIIEIAVNVEYNFLNYRQIRNNFKWCPYLTAGIANFMVTTPSFNDGPGFFNLSIPFGVGVKYMLNEHINLGLTFISSKTFTDNLDGLSSSLPSGMAPHKRGVDESTNDWFHFLGFSVSYTFYKIKCPAHYDDVKSPDYWQNMK